MKLELARKPTPIDRIVLDGKTILVKRDDLTDFVASGNKIRKLEYLLGEAVEKKATVVMTCGAVQSNHARATAYLSIRLGMRPILFLRKWYPGTDGGNFMLDRIMGVEVVMLEPEEYSEVNEIMSRKAEELERSGERVYIIPEGGSNSTGAKGYVDAVFEISRQLDLNEIDAIYVATSSAGTHAGLLAGLKILGYKTRVVGVKVNTRPVELIRERIKRMGEELGVPLEDSDIEILEDFVGPDYAVPAEEDVKTIFEVGRTGIILDPVYTAKAFRGMLETMGNSRVLFIHTGGTFGLMAQIDIAR